MSLTQEFQDSVEDTLISIDNSDNYEFSSNITYMQNIIQRAEFFDKVTKRMLIDLALQIGKISILCDMGNYVLAMVKFNAMVVNANINVKALLGLGDKREYI